SVTPFIRALLCSSVSTPPGTWSSTTGAPKLPAGAASARVAGAAANAPAATVAAAKTFRRLNPLVLSGNLTPSFDLSSLSMANPLDKVTHCPVQKNTGEGFGSARSAGKWFRRCPNGRVELDRKSVV